MNKLILTKEGVFPIVKDCVGNQVSDQPKTGLELSGTIQGEGKLTGVPSIFIRLSGCNLRCIWQMDDGRFCRCDTTHASFHPSKVFEANVEDIVSTVKHNLGSIKHVVITGGEPLLQKRPLVELCRRLKKDFKVHITLESNGTLFDNAVAQWVDLFSISPKLANSIPTAEKLAKYQLSESGPYKFHDLKRVNLPGLQDYIDLTNATDKELQLKFVIGKREDYFEIKTHFLNKLNNWKPEDIILMPLGATREELAQSSPLVLEMAISNGWRFTPRVHIDLFGAVSGV